MEENSFELSIGFGNIANIILAATILIFGLRDIIVSTVDKDFSRSKYKIIRWFLAKKEKVAASHFLIELGLKRGELIRKIKGEYPNDYKGAIHFLSKCIVEAHEGTTYTYGSEGRHTSSHYVDSMGYTQDEDNCILLCDIMKHLIEKIDGSYRNGYVFSIKGGNLPLTTKFSSRNNVLSIIAKDTNEIVSSGGNKDCFINYEGFNRLVELAKKNEHIHRKGIAIACNLSNGNIFLRGIKKYNEEMTELKNSGTIPENIGKIENVFILYRTIKNGDLDDKYEEAGLKCYRYFDLDDNLKACLCNIEQKKKGIDDFICYKCIKASVL